jgi:2-oxoglutarate ferredoxin oxidoreductase subunit alpha
MPEPHSLSLAFTGSGGSGAVTAGMILLEAAGRAGLYGHNARAVGPQIRGGEAVSMVRCSEIPVACPSDHFDVVLGLDWRNADRFADELPLNRESLIVTDPGAGPVPEVFVASGARLLSIPMQGLAAESCRRSNMVAVGVAAALLGFPMEALRRAVEKILAGKGQELIAKSMACIESGRRACPPSAWAPRQLPDLVPPRWSLSGNQACGLGALRGGVRFVAAYPITPASEILEWLAPRLDGLGGSLLQAEDELAAINMIIGASYGGVPSLTATSGPGLSLMLEGLGLAVAAEIPVVVVNVMRGGPSTGLPTKSEQTDLNIALYGMHGEAPHLVLAPLSIGDCVFTTEWAVRLAEHLQTPAIVLSDQSLAQSRTLLDPLPRAVFDLERQVTSDGVDYHRYRDNAEGISAMAVPGTPGCIYTAEGLEHDELGLPSSQASDHARQLDKRQRKLECFDFGAYWAEVTGDGRECLVTWGSISGAVLEAAARLRASGRATRVVALRLLAPLQRRSLLRELEGAQRVLVIEQSHSGQLFHYLRAQGVLPQDARSLARPGPLPIRPGEIVHFLAEER